MEVDRRIVHGSDNTISPGTSQCVHDDFWGWRRCRVVSVRNTDDETDDDRQCQRFPVDGVPYDDVTSSTDWPPTVCCPPPFAAPAGVDHVSGDPASGTMRHATLNYIEECSWNRRFRRRPSPECNDTMSRSQPFRRTASSISTELPPTNLLDRTCSGTSRKTDSRFKSWVVMMQDLNRRSIVISLSDALSRPRRRRQIGGR